MHTEFQGPWPFLCDLIKPIAGNYKTRKLFPPVASGVQKLLFNRIYCATVITIVMLLVIRTMSAVSLEVTVRRYELH